MGGEVAAPWVCVRGAVRLWERGGRAWQGCVVARGARGATCFVRAGAHVVCGTGLKPQCGSAAS